MAIFRARNIIPKSSLPTLKSLPIQPSTPNKTHEISLMSFPSSDGPEKSDLLGLDFDSTLVPISSFSPSTSLRRSSRLASKSNLVVGDNDKKLNADEVKENGSQSGFDSEKGFNKGDKEKTRVKKGENTGSGNKGIRVLAEVMDRDEEREVGNLGFSSGSSSLRESERLMEEAVSTSEEIKEEIDLNSVPLGFGSENQEMTEWFFNSQSRNETGESNEIEVIDLVSDDNMNEDNGLLHHEINYRPEEDRESDRKMELDLNLTPGRISYMYATENDPTVNGSDPPVNGSVEGTSMDIDPNPSNADEGTSSGKRKFTKEEKGKEKVVSSAWLSVGLDPLKPEELTEESDLRDVANSLIQLQEKMAEEERRTISMANVRRNALRRRGNRERFQLGARQSASRFARFQPQQEENNQPAPAPAPVNIEVPALVVDQNVEDWPGPYSTAMKIIRDRTLKNNAPLRNSAAGSSNVVAPAIEWTPSVKSVKKRFSHVAPSLLDMSMKILADNVEAIVSLDSVPDAMRHKLSDLICSSRKMDSHFMELLASGSPSEIRVKDCSWLTEEQFTKIFEACDTTKLMVLQLDLCGRCMPDYILRATLAKSPSSLSSLSSISLKGACRLTDVGLKTLISATPSLRSINLGQCSLLSSTGISSLASSLGSVIRELYLDDCQNIDMMLILPSLQMLEHLEVLSLADNQTVCDDFVCKFVSVCGRKLKELVFADCWKLTDTSLKAIAQYCSDLRALDVANLYKLTNSALGYLANGCRSLQTLKLRRNNFSDETVAAFVEASGEHLTELSLNNVKKVGNDTAISLARRCSKNLLSLDLSWCRYLTDNALGLIVDSCSSLKILKLFGCTQITNTFVDGHSNPLVQIIGLKLTPILENMNVLGIQEAPLRYSSIPLPSEPQIQLI